MGKELTDSFSMQESSPSKPIYHYVLAELLTPEINDPNIEESTKKFGDRFYNYYNNGFGISLPDNPMGKLRFTSTEIIEYLGLPTDRVIVHINTFHRKEDLDQIITSALNLGVKDLLCISGDGNPRLHRLEERELGFEPTPIGAATSIELLKYIHREFPGKFSCGVAFNPYEEHNFEFGKLVKKIDAGAEFIGTQLYLPSGLVEGFEHRSNLELLAQYKKPVVFGIWTPPSKPGDNSEKSVKRINTFLEVMVPYYSEQIIALLKEKLIKDGYNTKNIIKSVKEKYAPLYPSFTEYFTAPILQKMKEWMKIL